MNLLTSKLPDYIKIGGKEYKVKTDWREWVNFTCAMSSEIPSSEKAAICLNIVIDKIMDDVDPYDLIMALLDFCNPPSAFPSVSKVNKIDDVNYDFERDAEFIYSSFMQQYHINLENCVMHWYTFKALFNGLNDDTEFSKILGYRAMSYKQIHSIKDSEQRNFYLRMKKQYSLKNTSKSNKQSALTDFACSFI